MLGATALTVLALYGLAATSDDTSVAGAYCAFTCGLVIWGWHEMSFLMGFVTGPRREACARGCRGWRHLWPRDRRPSSGTSWRSRRRRR